MESRRNHGRSLERLLYKLFSLHKVSGAIEGLSGFSLLLTSILALLGDSPLFPFRVRFANPLLTKVRIHIWVVGLSY
jgi:hypothetical protein